MFEVYCLTSPSGKRYVGFTSRGADRRWREHVQAAKRGASNPLQRAILKYGPEAFSCSLLERMTTASGAKQAERLWIKELGTLGVGGYNATLGGDGVTGHTLETRSKIGESSRGRVQSSEAVAKRAAALRGIAKSLEACANMSAAAKRRTGRKHSPETRAKMAESHRGKKLLPETCAKISEANRGKKRSPETCARISASKSGPRRSNKNVD